MKANVKGFIRNLVSDIFEELIEKKCLYDECGYLIDDYNGGDIFSEIESVASEVTEKWLDCIEEE